MLLVLTALTLSGGAVMAGGPVYFRHVAHQQGSVWLLAEDGSGIYAQRAMQPPALAVRLTDGSGRPYDWAARPPIAVARFADRWLVVDGSTRLTVFERSGSFQRVVTLPAPATLIAASPRMVWIYNGLMTARGGRIWVAWTDLRFTAVAATLLDESSRGDRVLGAQLVLAAGYESDLYYAHLIGKPVIHSLKAGGQKTSFPVAFSRTSRRDTLVSWNPSVPGLDAYSSPVGEIVPLGPEGLIVLRNREDVRRDGRLVPVLRLNVDRYGPDHRLRASATFGEPLRTVLRDEGKQVVALTLSGKVVTAPWTRPAPGGILP